MKRIIISIVFIGCIIGLAIVFLNQRHQIFNKRIEPGTCSNNLSKFTDIDQYENQVIHFYGDSIAQGVIFYKCEDEINIDQLKPFNRIQDLANILLIENGITPNMLRVRYARSQDVKRMQTELSLGIIKDGDIILFEDAGQHENNVTSRRKKFIDIKRVIEKSGRDVTLILTTMFDYKPSQEYPDSEYDIIVGNSGLTMNDVVRSIASDGLCSLLDWNKEMDLAVEVLNRKFRISPMYPDGIHPNAFGKLLLSVSILNHIGVQIVSYNSIQNTFHKLPADCYKWPDIEKKLGDKLKRNVIDIIIKLPSQATKTKF